MENGNYSWPGNAPTPKPKKKISPKGMFRRIVLAAVIAVVLLAQGILVDDSVLLVGMVVLIHGAISFLIHWEISHDHSKQHREELEDVNL